MRAEKVDGYIDTGIRDKREVRRHVEKHIRIVSVVAHDYRIMRRRRDRLDLNGIDNCPRNADKSERGSEHACEKRRVPHFGPRGAISEVYIYEAALSLLCVRSLTDWRALNAA